MKQHLKNIIYRAVVLPVTILESLAYAYTSLVYSIKPNIRLWSNLEVDKFPQQVRSGDLISKRLLECITRDETSIRCQGGFDDHEYARLLQLSLQKALAIDTKLPSWIGSMEGMSGRKYRYLINTLVERTPHARYLEVGSWAGSTACSAMFGHKVTACCIDNWSQFGGPKDVFKKNIDRVMNEAVTFRLIEADFRTVDYRAIGTYNIYCFDGPHTERDHIDGITIAQPALDDDYVLIVDDWNWEQVREGTMRAIESSGVTLIATVEIRTTQDNTHPSVLQKQHSDWHNGYFIAVCRKCDRPLPK